MAHTIETSVPEGDYSIKHIKLDGENQIEIVALSPKCREFMAEKMGPGAISFTCYESDVEVPLKALAEAGLLDCNLNFDVLFLDRNASEVQKAKTIIEAGLDQLNHVYEPNHGEGSFIVLVAADMVLSQQQVDSAYRQYVDMMSI